MRIAVDAINLAADTRGMGRYVRHILDDWDRDDVAYALVDRLAIRSAKRQRFDAIWYPWNGIRFTLDARRVLTIHDTFAFTYPHREFVARWRERAPIRRGVREADAIATVSRWSARQIAGTFGIDETSLRIISPVPDAWWQPAEPYVHDRPYVVFVAGPDERKNAQTLFAAFDRAFSDGAVTLFVIGNLRKEDGAVLQRASFSHRRMSPDDATLRSLYSGAHAVAVPSTAEGYGLMPVEAMSCGAPVIAADASALPESCDGAAYLVPPFAVEAWSAAMERIISDNALRDDLRARGFARVARIDRKAPARATLELLRQAP